MSNSPQSADANGVDSRLSETYPWSFEELLARLAQEQVDQEFPA
jgi:hypothetical protein